MQDPQAILAAAGPYYNYSDSTLKPWHLQATYQLFDESGNPTLQGTFQYWWVSPKVYRTTWTRPEASHSIWHTSDGRIVYLGSGNHLGYLESGIENQLFSPLPSPDTTDPAKYRLERNNLKIAEAEFPCVSVIPKGTKNESDFRTFLTYCFEPQLPVLRFTFGFNGSVQSTFSNLSKLAGKILAGDVQVGMGKQMMLHIKVDSVNAIDPADPALVPAKDAILRPDPTDKFTAPELLKKMVPLYPVGEKQQRISGTVLIDATIDIEGKVKAPHVIASPSPGLSAAALNAVSHWEFKPASVQGKPIAANLLLTVFFNLNR